MNVKSRPLLLCLQSEISQARIYEEIFKPVQLNALDFLRLMDIAERRVMLKGNDLTQEGRPHEEVFLIVEGTAEVRAEFRQAPSALALERFGCASFFCLKSFGWRSVDYSAECSPLGWVQQYCFSEIAVI